MSSKVTHIKRSHKTYHDPLFKSKDEAMHNDFIYPIFKHTHKLPSIESRFGRDFADGLAKYQSQFE